MKKFLIILVAGMLWSNVANSAKATCLGGECDILFSFHYEWVETNCFFSMFNEEVETSFLYFIVEDTGRKCLVFDSR